MQIKLFDKNLDIYIFQLDVNNYIKFCPLRGGIITNWVSDGSEILYFDEIRFQDKSKSIRGGIPILFPVCGSLDLSNSLFGKNYLKLMQHGFARDLKWKYGLNPNKDSLFFCLKDSETTRRYFPFNFKVRIEICLKVNCLEFEINIQNNTNREMPINFGLHPYLNISDFKNLDFFDYSINCQDQKTNVLSSTSNQLKNISNGIDLLIYTSGKSSFIDNGFKRQITLNHPYPFDLGVIWTDPPRKMLCLEPWTSPRNSLIDGFRTILIRPNDSQYLNASIQINNLT